MAEDIVKDYGAATEVAQAMAEDFVAFTNRCIKETKTAIVGITGGTGVTKLFEVLNSSAYIDRVDWENIFFLWTDERFVPRRNEANYYHRLQKILLCQGKGATHFLPVNTDSKMVSEAAMEYEQEVKTVLCSCEKDHMDLVILDLGEDGHTAGLFAGSYALQANEHNIVAVDDGKNFERISMTFKFLSETTSVWFTVLGEHKQFVLSKVLTQRLDYEDLPWDKRIGRVLPGAVLSQSPIVWYVDHEAYVKS